MSVTIYEIAKQAGVSSSTVARVLRGDVKETQERSLKNADRIRKIADELGYRPNRLARAFSRGKTYGIGLLYTDDAWIFEGVNMAVVNSLVRSLQGDGYHLVFVPIDQSNSWKDILLGGQIDGGLVFQEFELLEYLSVLDNILLPYRINPTLELSSDVFDRAR